MLCSREIFTDQSYHACIRSEKNPSIRSDACMTADYARGQPASAWPLAGQPCKVDCDLRTIARAHNRAFFVRLVRPLGPHVPTVRCSIMCTPIMHSTRSKLMPKWHFFLYLFLSVGNNAWGPLRFDLLSTDKYTNVTPYVMQELGELSKNVSFQG